MVQGHLRTTGYEDENHSGGNGGGDDGRDDDVDTRHQRR